jgi:hypothetical protein
MIGDKTEKEFFKVRAGVRVKVLAAQLAKIPGFVSNKIA